MEQLYNIRMNVPLGYRDGTLSFTKRNGQYIDGILSLFQNKTPFTGKLTQDGEITFSGQIITLTRTFSYQAKGKVDGTKIKLEVVGERSHFTISGEEAAA